ncbi:hypothetical protein Tco_0375421 [Tanacetum coccineum]
MDIIEEKVILKWGDEQDSEYSDDDNDDDVDKEDDTDDEGDDHINVDVEMAEPETVEREKEEKEEMTDAAKPDIEKSEEEEGDAEKAVGSSFPVKEATKFPLLSSSLSVSFGFDWRHPWDQTLRTLPKSRMTKQGNFTQRTPQAKKQSDQASRQVSKQASGSTNTPYDLVFPATGPYKP